MQDQNSTENEEKKYVFPTPECYICLVYGKHVYASIPNVLNKLKHLCAGHDMRIYGIFIDAHTRAPIPKEDLIPIPDFKKDDKENSQEKTPN